MMSKTGARRIAWVAVVAFALVISNWSLAYVARSWHVWAPLSWAVSLVFDGAALILADLALKAARLGDSTFGPNSFLVLLAGLSAWLNSYHAQLAGDPWQARVMFAAPPVVAVGVTELQLRHDRRAALREARRIADPLPALGGAMWINKPVAAYSAVRKILKHRLAGQLKTAGVTRPAGQEAAVRGPSRGQVRRSVKRVAAMKTFDPAAVRRAEEGIRADLDAGRPVSKRKSSKAHRISEYQAEMIIKSLRAERDGAAA